VRAALAGYRRDTREHARGCRCYLRLSTRGARRRWRRPDLILELAPLGFGPAIGADNPRRGARIDPAVERLVALAQLLPFEPSEPALGLHRDELLGDELLHPFGIDSARQMDIARRGLCAGFDLVVRRRNEPQEPVGLTLEGGDGDRPEPRAATEPSAAFSEIDMRGAGDRSRTVEPLDAFDRGDLGVASTASPGVDRRRLVARVDRELGKPKSRT